MKNKVTLHARRKCLLATLQHLKAIRQMRPHWGRLYARTLVRLVMVEMQIEEMEKQKEV